MFLFHVFWVGITYWFYRSISNQVKLSNWFMIKTKMLIHRIINSGLIMLFKNKLNKEKIFFSSSQSFRGFFDYFLPTIHLLIIKGTQLL
jgi:hypothetical protein